MKRRPSTPYNLARIVVDQTSGLLWGGEQMPLIEVPPALDDVDDANRVQRERDRDNAMAIVSNCALDAIMLEVHEAAAPGSAAILVRPTENGEPHFEIIAGKYVTPVYDPSSPGKLIAVVRVYPTNAKVLRAAGYALPGDVADTAIYWMRIDYGALAEQRYEPLNAYDYAHIGTARESTKQIIAWIPDSSRRYPHNFGVVNVVWANCLIGGDAIDSRCMFGDIADIQVEITYLLSQVGRGLRFSADPLLARKRGELNSTTISKIDPLGDDDQSFELEGENGETVRSASNVLDLGKDGDAKFLEISGDGIKVSIDYVKMLREWALEVVGAMKSDASTTKGVTSGRALEMLYQALQLLLKRMRIALGTRTLIPLVRLLIIGVYRGELTIDGVSQPNPSARYALKWPQWSTPRGSELLAYAQAVEILAGGSAKVPVTILPPDRLTPMVASELGFDDPATIGDEAKSLRSQVDDDPEETAPTE